VGVVNNTVVDDLKLSYEEDTLVRYLMPAKVKQITVELKAKFRKNKEDTIALSCSRSI
jgi:hypothetical protein